MARTLSVLCCGALSAFLIAGCIGPNGVGADPMDPIDETRYGAIGVSVETTGTPDPDGYIVQLDETRSSPIPSTGETGFTTLPTGYYDVHLVDIDPPCSTAVDQIAVYVFPDTTVTAAFNVTCP